MARAEIEAVNAFVQALFSFVARSRRILAGGLEAWRYYRKPVVDLKAAFIYALEVYFIVGIVQSYVFSYLVQLYRRSASSAQSGALEPGIIRFLEALSTFPFNAIIPILDYLLLFVYARVFIFMIASSEDKPYGGNRVMAMVVDIWALSRLLFVIPAICFIAALNLQQLFSVSALAPLSPYESLLLPVFTLSQVVVYAVFWLILIVNLKRGFGVSIGRSIMATLVVGLAGWAINVGIQLVGMALFAPT